MAIALSGTNQGLTRLTTLADYNAPYTVAFWFYHTATGVADTIYSHNDGNADQDTIRINAGDQFRVMARIGGVGADQNDGFTTIINTWYFVGLVRSSVTDLTAYLYNLSGSEVSSPTATQDVTGRTAQVRANVGHLNLNDDFTGRIHCIKIWTAALTPAELQRERVRVRPMRFANLSAWYPTINATVAERDIAAGLDWTFDGTPTDAAGPPISWGMPQSQIGVPAAVAGASAPPISRIRRNTLLRM